MSKEKIENLLEENDMNYLNSSMIRTHLDDINLLEDMGFSYTLIRKVYSFLRPQSIEQAIIYMTKENGIYQHEFREGKKSEENLCFLCGEEKKYHMDYIPEDENELNEIRNSDLYNSNNLSTSLLKRSTVYNMECEICAEKFGKEKERKKIINPKCNHFYCYTCWLHYLSDQIENSNVEKIKCPNFECKEYLNEDFIMELIKDNTTLIDKYKKFKVKLEIINNPNKKFCPKKGCDSYAIRDNENIKEVKCKNNHKFCFNCLRDWHGNTDCDLELEKEFQIWKKGKIIKQCPNCKIWTEKNEGCNHMKCVECKYEWCWLCSGKYSLNHFYEGKCNGLQFFKPKTEEDIKNALDKNINKKPVISNPVFRPLPRIEDTYGYQERIRNVTQQWREEEWRVGHIIIDNEHPYHFPSKRNNEYVAFFYAYAMMSKCDYFGYILLYFFMTLEFCGIIMHNRILNVEDPYYGFNRNKIYMNKKFNIFILLSLVFMQFFVYFFFNLACMILITIPQIFYWPFFYYMREGWYNVLIYNVTTGLLNIKVNYGR